jgi:hypothetical protein
VATLGGVFGWEQMFTPNFGLTLGGNALAYTIEDEASTNAGVTISHKRSDYSGALRLRARLPLVAGLELAVDPGLMVRMVGVDNAQAGNALPALDQYLYTGWLGYGPSVAGGLGWHLFGPLSIAGVGEFNYLMAGGMNSASVTPIFPLMGWKAGGEMRLDMGALGVTAGYNLTNWSFNGGDANSTLTQSWSGPYLKFAIVY